MSLLKFHKILISTAIVFFLVYAGWELLNYERLGHWGALPRSGASLAVAVGLTFYLRLIRRYRVLNKGPHQ